MRMERKFVPRQDEPTTLDELHARREKKDSAKKQEQSGEGPNFPLTEDVDFEAYPTPADPEKRGELHRIEVNVNSLCELTRNMETFIERAETISAQASTDRDEGQFIAVDTYFKRMRGLIARIYNDVIGHNYTTSYTHSSLATTEITPQLRSQMNQTCDIILNTLSMANTDILLNLPPGTQWHDEGVAIPFANQIKDIRTGAQYLKKYFANHE